MLHPECDREYGWSGYLENVPNARKMAHHHLKNGGELSQERGRANEPWSLSKARASASASQQQSVSRVRPNIYNEHRFQNSNRLSDLLQNPPKTLLTLSLSSFYKRSSKLEKTLKSFKLGKINVSNPKLWIVVGIGVAGVIILTERRRRRRGKSEVIREDFGAFIERLELLPALQPPPPAARHPLAGLTFAVKDIFDIKEYVTGFGNPDWKRTHDPANRTAVAVTCLLKHGAACVGKTVMDELAFGITGENMHYGTPTNPEVPYQIPGGSSSGSAVAVAAELVDFTLGTDTVGCVRIPASFCGILGFRPSHGIVSTIGVLANSQSLDTVGWFARDPSILHRVGHVLLQAPLVERRRARRFIFADDCFQLSKVPTQMSMHVVSRTTENLSGYQPPKHMNIGQYIASTVPSLKGFREASTNMKQGISTLKALSHVMLLLQRYEFKSNHEEWVKTEKPKLGPDISARVLAAVNTTHENIKLFYKARTEIRGALNSLLKDDGILVIPTAPDAPLKPNSKKSLSTEFQDKALALLSIAGMSGCCQVSIPLGKHDGCPISVSFIASHGADKFLLDTVLDMYSCLQEQVSIASNSLPLPDTNGDIDASELLKEKVYYSLQHL
ncbi:outer envelope protein 64, mitochondrial isoform X2 [Magnolia sinica]|uniref:outer envelope protein 64, mitochondrial isoform X2 n=1 Tax=Magnolia sinica TaxID=86752 RepID=UPI00265A321A|nr:outer envelope protein 64, mitochondrial isoform X2 [Magnolia sinica]